MTNRTVPIGRKATTKVAPITNKSYYYLHCS